MTVVKRLKTTITQLTASPGQTGLGVIPQILLQASDPPAPSFRVKAGKSYGKVAIFILLRWHSLRLISSKLGPLVGSRSFNIGVGSPEEGIPSQNHLGLGTGKKYLCFSFGSVKQSCSAKCILVNSFLVPKCKESWQPELCTPVQIISFTLGHIPFEHNLYRLLTSKPSKREPHPTLVNLTSLENGTLPHQTAGRPLSAKAETCSRAFCRCCLHCFFKTNRARSQPSSHTRPCGPSYSNTTERLFWCAESSASSSARLEQELRTSTTKRLFWCARPSASSSASPEQ